MSLRGRTRGAGAAAFSRRYPSFFRQPALRGMIVDNNANVDRNAWSDFGPIFSTTHNNELNLTATEI